MTRASGPPAAGQVAAHLRKQALNMPYTAWWGQKTLQQLTPFVMKGVSLLAPVCR